MGMSEREHHIKVLEQFLHDYQEWGEDLELEKTIKYAISSLKTDEAYQLEYESRDCVEVVRCKDCKYFEYDHFENVGGIPLIVAHEICIRCAGGMKTSENGYCFLGERKEQTDET